MHNESMHCESMTSFDRVKWTTFTRDARKIEKERPLYHFHTRTTKVFHLCIEFLIITSAVCYGFLGMFFAILGLVLTYRTIDSELNAIPEEQRKEILDFINDRPITTEIVVEVIKKWRNLAIQLP